jgi:hypothetical protein
MPTVSRSPSEGTSAAARSDTGRRRRPRSERDEEQRAELAVEGPMADCQPPPSRAAARTRPCSRRRRNRRRARRAAAARSRGRERASARGRSGATRGREPGRDRRSSSRGLPGRVDRRPEQELQQREPAGRTERNRAPPERRRRLRLMPTRFRGRPECRYRASVWGPGWRTARHDWTRPRSWHAACTCSASPSPAP